MFLYKAFNTGKLQTVPLPPVLTVPLKSLLELGHSSLFFPSPSDTARNRVRNKENHTSLKILETAHKWFKGFKSSCSIHAALPTQKKEKSVTTFAEHEHEGNFHVNQVNSAAACHDRSAPGSSARRAGARQRREFALLVPGSLWHWHWAGRKGSHLKSSKKTKYEVKVSETFSFSASVAIITCLKKKYIWQTLAIRETPGNSSRSVVISRNQHPAFSLHDTDKQAIVLPLFKYLHAIVKW